jgi:hypothetical protein
MSLPLRGNSGNGLVSSSSPLLSYPNKFQDTYLVCGACKRWPFGTQSSRWRNVLKASLCGSNIRRPYSDFKRWKLFCVSRSCSLKSTKRSIEKCYNTIMEAVKIFVEIEIVFTNCGSPFIFQEGETFSRTMRENMIIINSHVKIGDSINCTSLSIWTKKSTWTSRSPLTKMSRNIQRSKNKSIN